MITLEKIERLRARTGAGFAEVKAALEEADGDVDAAEALLNRKQHPPEDGGKAKAEAGAQTEAEPGSGQRSGRQEPGAGAQRDRQAGQQTGETGEQAGTGPEAGAWSGAQGNTWSGTQGNTWSGAESERWGSSGGNSSLNGVLGFLQQLAVMANRNRFEIFRNGSLLFSIPLSILAILMVPLFWAILPSLFAGFFLGCSYRFCGPDFKQLP